MDIDEKTYHRAYGMSAPFSFHTYLSMHFPYKVLFFYSADAGPLGAPLKHCSSPRARSSQYICM